MSLSLPSSGQWVAQSIDLLGSCVFIGVSLSVTEGFYLKIWAQIVGIAIALWVWDSLYAWLRSTIFSTLDRRG